MTSHRAVVFIDGNNWFHWLKNVGVEDRARLDYGKISRKLLGPRDWVGTRYYIGRVDQQQDAASYANQRSFVASLQNTDRRITVHFGRIEPRAHENNAAAEFLRYLHGLPQRIDQTVFADLVALAKKHESTIVWVEKAVDVHLAVDMVVMATRQEYEAAYLLSADGDFTSAVEFVRGLGKKVYVATPGYSAQLQKVADKFIPLKREWFRDCYR
jgi:uncharacterized LabA/DUF88 family protein